MTSHDNINDLTKKDRTLMAFYIGNMLLNLPSASKLARHNRPLSTFRDYADAMPEDDKIKRMAKEYLHDLLAGPHGGKTEAILAKWFDDDGTDPFKNPFFGEDV